MASQMSAQTSEKSLLLTVWHAIGYELMIFIVTLSMVVIMHKLQGKKFFPPKKCVADSPQEVHKVPASPTRIAQPPKERVKPTAKLAERQHASCGPAKIVNEILDIAKNKPNLRSAHRAIALYSELSSSSVPQAVSHTGVSATELYTGLLQCAIRIGHYQVASGLFDDMAQQGVPRTLQQYEVAMKHLAGQKKYHLALSMYDRLAADGFEASEVTYSCLINFAAEVNEYHRAIGFFDKLASKSTPSIRAYMTILGVHSKRQDWPASLATLRDMQQRNVALDTLAFNIALGTGVAAEQLEAVEELLKDIETSSPSVPDTVSYNTLLKGYVQRNQARSALNVISHMQDRGLKPNAITFNTAMDGAIRGNLLQEAWSLLQVMRECGNSPDKFTCSILLKSVAKSPTPEHINSCLKLLEEVASKCDSNLRSTLYQSLLDAAVQVSDADALVALLLQLRAQKVVPTASMYRCLVQALTEKGDSSHLNAVWQQMLSDTLRPPPQTLVSLLQAHLKKKEVVDAVTSFELLRVALRCDNLSQRGSDNRALLEECTTGFLRALCQGQHCAEARTIYMQAKLDGTAHKLDNATIMLLAKVQAEAGQLSDSWTAISDLLEHGHKPSDSTLHAFLNACMKQSESSYAPELVRKTSQKAILLSQATYILIFKILVRCQQSLAAVTLFEELARAQIGGRGLLQEALDVLVASASRRGRAGASDMQMFNGLAMAYNLSIQ